jgi:hypothetical protein
MVLPRDLVPQPEQQRMTPITFDPRQVRSLALTCDVEWSNGNIQTWRIDCPAEYLIGRIRADAPFRFNQIRGKHSAQGVLDRRLDFLCAQ